MTIFSRNKQTQATHDDSLDATPNIPQLTTKQTTYAGIVALLAWTFAVYDLITFGNLLPKIQESFGWSDSYTSYVATFVQLGALLVAFCIGPVIDILGRRFALMLTTGGAAVSSGLAALAFGPVSLIIFRMLSGFGMSEQAVNSAYLNEIFPAKTRGRLFSLVQAGWPLGVMLSAGLAGLFQETIGWRGVFAIALAPLAIMFILRLWLKESPYFLKVAHLRRLQAANRFEQAKALSHDWQVKLPSSGYNTYGALFGENNRKHTIFLGLSFFFKLIADSQTTILATIILVQVKGIELTAALWTVFIGNGVAIFGYLVLGWLGDVIGRRATVIIAQMMVAVSTCLLLFAAESFSLTIAFFSAILFFAQGAAAPFFTYVGESYPTEMRGSGAAFVNVVGPVGTVFGPLLYAVLQTVGFTPAESAASGAVAALLAALFLFGAKSIKPRQELESIHKQND